MRWVIFILIMTCGSAFAQEWRDSLSVARKAYADKEYGKALQYYRSAQQKAPKEVDLSDEIGQSAYRAREFEQAEKVYQQSTSSIKDPSRKARVQHNLGNTRMKKKDWNGAIEAYKEALRKDPDNERTRYNLSEAIRRKKAEEKKKQQEQNNSNDRNNDDQQGGNKPKQSDQNQQGSQGQKKSSSGNEQKDQSQRSGLPNKSVERMLDELMKAEAATKRKMGGGKDKSGSTSSGKDW